MADLLEVPEFEENLPHTVGFFREAKSANADARLTYMEIRVIRSIEEFWKFLNDLDL